MTDYTNEQQELRNRVKSAIACVRGIEFASEKEAIVIAAVINYQAAELVAREVSAMQEAIWRIAQNR